MPYATPTSPIPSPAKDTHSRKAWLTPPTHIEDMEAGPSYTSGPMPGIPRRASSSQSTSAPTSGQSTPRRVLCPASSRRPSASGPSTQAFAASRPMEGLPRRSSSGQGAFGVTGLPPTTNGEGSLGLKLHPSPTKAPNMERGVQDSISSTSTVDSSLPTTPNDEPKDLPMSYPSRPKETDGSTTPPSSIPFPSFEPPILKSVPIPHRALSQTTPSRPTIMTSRRASGLGHQRGNGPQGGSLQIPFPTSASTSHIPGTPGSTASNNTLLRPTASMIRKKSGEVVKPSLKTRSMSTPDLSRQGDAEPKTPVHEDTRLFPDERSKSVRFADGDDGDPRALESVVLFLREQRPIAVGKAADPDHAGPVTDTETEADDTDASDFVQFRTRRNAAARAADEQGQIMLEGGSRVPRLRVDFSPDARGSLDGENVIVERVELINGPGPLCMRGTVIARNLAFQKWVSVRFTLDHWQTRSEVSADHVTHVPASTTGDQGWDRFSFTIKLEDFKRKIEDRQLVLCVRYSIGDQEWWDSNSGMNYNFTFRKGPPRRPTRVSGPPALGAQYTATTSIAGLRQRSSSPSSEISKAFGVAPTTAQPTGPRSWVFPKYASQHLGDGPERSDSPVPSAAPPTAYKIPAPPDVHSHLTLSKYCAPSPPQSPPKEATFSLVAIDGSAVLESPHPSAETKVIDMNLMGGQFATLSPPPVSAAHERRSSWNGQSGSWDSFAQAMDNLSGDETTPHASTDGDSTPIAPGSQSPTTKSGSSGESSPDRSRPLGFKRSTGDLRALLDGDGTGLLTPPPSNLSSPPSPSLPMLSSEPPMSPSSSITTGESSPVNTVSSTNDSITDLANLAIDVDPETRGRSPKPEYKMLNSHSYQDFLDKFCFFTSPRMTPDDEPLFNRPSFIPLSGAASPNGFPFFAQSTNASNSPRNTPTPTRSYDSSMDAFGFTGVAPHGQIGGPATPRAAPVVRSQLGGPAMSPLDWAGTQVGNSFPSLSAQ